MKALGLSPIVMIAGLLTIVPALAQTTAHKQATQDGNSPTTVGLGNAAAHKQRTDGDSPTIVGPGSKAYKQQTQSLSHSQPPLASSKTN